ncbi:MAG: SPOR domain-containing protein [Thiotrichaceae bacterium]|nr:SPOR domain-containing protein [Thiotrichaceae bacterium]
MTKDYKQVKTNDSEPKTSYLWMVSGMTIGLFIGLAMFFFSNPQAKLNDMEQVLSNEVNIIPVLAEDNGPEPISTVITESRNLQERKRATFTYFGVLPNLERDVQIKQDAKDKLIKVTVETKTNDAIVTAETETPDNAITGNYLLQIASFRKEEMAERAKEKLASQGIGTRIEKKVVRGRSWYRIITVPIQLQSELQNWKKILEGSGHQPLVIHLKS